MKLKFALLIIVAVSAVVQAQEAKPREASDDQSQSVRNDDRGRAFIISAEAEAWSVPAANSGRIVEPQQISIFLGRGWESGSMRAREPGLTNLLANMQDQSQLSAVDQRGIKNLYAVTSSQEKLDAVAPDGTVSDLEIQRVLADMLKDGSLQRPNPSTIYVVFLDAVTRSTLGAMIGGKHYLAYHSFFNTSGARIHYVVVPFAEDKKAAYQIALRAFLAAALNPSGAGS